jgi:hypothetical protein
MRHSTFKFQAALTLLALIVMSLPAINKTTVSLANPESGLKASPIASFNASSHASVLYQVEGRIAARYPTSEELKFVTQSAPSTEMHDLNAYTPSAIGGLKIVLMGTPQLESYPEAKAAFLKAAATWESAISTPMTIIVDIDYGPTQFGEQVPSDLAGFNCTQLLIGNPIYLRFLEQLLNNASTEEELDLYYRMPQPFLKTDQGDTSAIIAPSPVYRALGLIERHADVAPDPPHFGRRPAIWINSSVPFDFDYSNGIDADKYDFDAVVSRAFGQILGFYSAAGRLEVEPDAELAASAWDAFRLPPNSTLESLSSAARILKSGGNPFFFMGTDDLPLSTALPDGSGGDGSPAGYWKDDVLIGRRIGIMDPTIPIGKRQMITLNDIKALDLFGYALRPFGNTKPVLASLSADLNGDILTLDGSLIDPDGDVIQARLEFLDKKDRVVGATAPFAADFGIVPSQFFNFDIRDMGSVPSVVQVSLVVIDTKGNESNAVTADFSGGDSGAPKIKSFNFKGGEKLIIKGKGLKPGVEIEVNGFVINPPSGINAAKNGKTVEIQGTIEELNLRSGPNRIRAIRNGLRSKLFIGEL